MAEPLRILQILRAPVGGLFRHVNDLTRELSARGHHIGIVADSLTSDSLTMPRLDALRPLCTLGIHTFPMPRTIGSGDITTPIRVRRLAQALDIDVLHGHGAKGGVNAKFARAGRNKRVALNTPHGGVLNYKPGSRAGAFFRTVERALMPWTDAYVFESAFAQRAFSEKIAVPPRGPVIHNGLSPAEFEPITPDMGARDFVFIGEFRDVKGISYLLDALKDVKAPDGRPASIAMAGGGPDFEAAKAQIERNGMTDRVDLLGVQPARPTLKRGRCMVVPSLAESLPYVILEGASAGRPVISTDVGGIAEIYGPTASSLIPAADTAALRMAMQAFMDDPEGADREASVRLDYIRKGFSVSYMTDQIEALYRDLLAARAASLTAG
ncbi:MAG: glycosyltransferase family 4 protein [Devosia sp.]